MRDRGGRREGGKLVDGCIMELASTKGDWDLLKGFNNFISGLSAWGERGDCKDPLSALARAS